MANLEYGSTSQIDSGNVTQEEIYKFKNRIVELGFLAPPVGTVMPYIAVSFSGSNTGPAYPLGSTIAAVKTYVETETNGKWTVCDGSAVADAESPWNGKNVPNITGDRFLMGSSAMGSIGGVSNHFHNSNASNTLTSFSLNGSINGAKASFCTATNVGGVSVTGGSTNACLLDASPYFNPHSHNVKHTHAWLLTKAGARDVFTYTSVNCSNRSGIDNTAVKVGDDETRSDSVDLTSRWGYNVDSPRTYYTTGALFVNTSNPTNATCGNNATSCETRPTLQNCIITANNASGAYPLTNFQNNQNNHAHTLNLAPTTSFDNKPNYLTSFFIIRIK